MFHTIRQPILDRMKVLEEQDSRDRQDGTDRLKRLRQIPPETGKFLALLAAGAPEGEFVEIGTSAGYSALWIALACEQGAGYSLPLKSCRPRRRWPATPSTPPVLRKP
ncbi:MAG: hypothetical protein AB9891_05685 [Anaerolineaceae bacterium]